MAFGTVTEHVTCSDFPDAPECCSSCHWDENEGYSDLTQLFRGPHDGETMASVCCVVSGYLLDAVDSDWRFV